MWLLRVRSDAMIGAGILEGDLALVGRGAPAKDGDTVIAEADGEWTMRYLQKKGVK
jgi:repressor LexA